MSARIEINDIDDLDDGANGGNPNLQPYTTKNADMSVEWYPERGGSYGLGFFHKKLESFIARGSSPETIFIGGELATVDVRRPVNTDGGTINGVEFQFHVPFDSFTGGFMSYFGINGSYTYVDAEMDAVVPERGTPISLRGTSEKSGNLVFYFEREKTEGRTIVDMNVDYIIMENMKIRFSANNLTEERRSRYWDTATTWFSDERDNGREYVLEFRYASD
jgi:TonB-dependent receptor